MLHPPIESAQFVHILNHHPITSSRQIGAAGDNAAMESLFAPFQKNASDRKSWRTREEPRIAITTRIERTYHRQARLGILNRTKHDTMLPPRNSQPGTSTVTSSCARPALAALRAARSSAPGPVTTNRINQIPARATRNTSLCASLKSDAFALTCSPVNPDRNSNLF